MWEKLFDLMTKVFTLTSKVDRHEKEIEKLQQENRYLLEIINHQKAQIDVLVYAVQSESDKTKLWVEKELAKFEQRLLLKKPEKDDEKD